jgi:alkylation response protein AidB-like acyl-CoA dehydrogenase
MFVPYAAAVDYLIWVARTSATTNPEEGITVFMVDAKSPGITFNELKTIAHDRQCEVVFNKVRVPAESILGSPGRGWEVVQKVVERAAVATCCDTVGCLQQAAWKISEGMPSTWETAVAKAWTSLAAPRVIALAHQIHGAIGTTMDHDLHLYTKRTKAAESAFGDADFYQWKVVHEIAR